MDLLRIGQCTCSLWNNNKLSNIRNQCLLRVKSAVVLRHSFSLRFFVSHFYLFRTIQIIYYDIFRCVILDLHSFISFSLLFLLLSPFSLSLKLRDCHFFIHYNLNISKVACSTRLTKFFCCAVGTPNGYITFSLRLRLVFSLFIHIRCFFGLLVHQDCLLQTFFYISCLIPRLADCWDLEFVYQDFVGNPTKLWQSTRKLMASNCVLQYKHPHLLSLSACRPCGCIAKPILFMRKFHSFLYGSLETHSLIRHPPSSICNVNDV